MDWLLAAVWGLGLQSVAWGGGLTLRGGQGGGPTSCPEVFGCFLVRSVEPGSEGTSLQGQQGCGLRSALRGEQKEGGSFLTAGFLGRGKKAEEKSCSKPTTGWAKQPEVGLERMLPDSLHSPCLPHPRPPASQSFLGAGRASWTWTVLHTCDGAHPASPGATEDVCSCAGLTV